MGHLEPKKVDSSKSKFYTVELDMNVNTLRKNTNYFLQTFAHELGHSLGMPHDFIDELGTSTPRNDKSGQSCLRVDGVMSYKVWFNIFCNQEKRFK